MKRLMMITEKTADKNINNTADSSIDISADTNINNTDDTSIDISANGDLSLLRQIPDVLRVRGYRLYLAGKHSNNENWRLVDLWLNGGAAILGHTPSNMLRELKNTASRGLYAPFPHFTERRFLKALSKILPGYSFRIYAAPPEELKNVKLWRPYADPKNPFYIDDMSESFKQHLIIPVLPGIQTWRNGLPFGLCVVAFPGSVPENKNVNSENKNISSKNANLKNKTVNNVNETVNSIKETKIISAENLLTQLPASDNLPPVLLAVTARGIHDILAKPERAKVSFPRITKTLKNTRWRINGIYLTLKEDVNEKTWETLIHKFLEAGFLLPPLKSHPLILPGELSKGEETKLAAVLNN